MVGIKLHEIDDNKILVHGKGGKDRYVYINVKAQLALANYLNKRTDHNPYLFARCVSVEKIKGRRKEKYWKSPELTEPDDHYGASSVEHRIRELGRKCGGIKAHPHKFRRTCATWALRRGMPIEQVSKMLGHANLGVTQIYLDIREKDLERSHERYVL